MTEESDTTVLERMGFDAQKWSEEFLKMFRVLKVEHGTAEGQSTMSIDDQHGLMIGWFANALMRGFDEHRWRTRLEPEALARMFHESYERLAPLFNYETRKASAVPWTDVPADNKRLMIAVAKEIQGQLA